MFSLLMLVRLRSARNVALDSLRRHPFWSVGLTVLGIGFFVAVFVAFFIFFRFAERLSLLEETSFQVFYLLMLFLFAGAVPFVASTLLHSADYSALFCAPIRPRAVLAAKLVDATVASSLQFTVLGIPAMVACAAALGLYPWAWLLLPLIITLFAFLPALLTAFGLLTALALLGMRRLRAAIALVNGVMALAVCIIFIVEAQHLPVRSGVFGESLSSISLMAQSQSSVIARLSPSGWFVSLLQNLSPRHPFALSSILGYFGAILGLNALFFALCVVLGERLISAASVAEENEGGGTLATKAESKETWLQRFCTPLVAAILYKDFRYLFRDSVLLSQLAMPALLFLVPFVLLFQKGSGIHLNEEIFPFTGGMVGVILFMQSSILSLSSIGLEGRAFWQYIASPNATSQLLWAKFLMSTAISGGISAALLLFAGVASHVAFPLLALMVFGVLVCAAGLCGAGVGIAASFPRFIYENPAHRVSAWAMILGFFGSVGYLIATFILFGGAWFANNLLERPFPIGCFAFLVHLVFTLTLIAFSLSVGAKRITRYEWEH